MSATILRPVFVRTNRTPRPVPGTVVPIRTDWRSLVAMAAERRMTALTRNAEGDMPGYWRLLEDAVALETHARRLRCIEEAAMCGELPW